MKSKLVVFILSAAILGSSSATLASDKEGRRYEEPRAQHAQQRDRDNDRYHATGHRNVRGDRYRDRRLDRHAGHGKRWSRHHPRYRHGWSHRNHHGKHANRGRYYPLPHGYGPARHYDHPLNGVSIILHGHF